MIRRSVLLLFAAASIGAAQPAPKPLIDGLDHIPLAVRDLERATADFQKLGFVLKPGRPHGDSIRNTHVKFPNGTEIELITATAATDEITADYVAWLKGGDGPAYLGVYSADLPALTTRLTRLGIKPTNDGDLVSFPQTPVPHRLFFADRLRSPTDRPEHFAHPNTAYRLQGVWLAGAEPERRLLTTLGATPAKRHGCAPFGASLERLSLPGGDEINVAPASPRQPPSRSIVGATVMVRSLATLRAVLKHNHVGYVPGCTPDSVWVRPADAHNMWLEFRQ